MKPYFEDTQVTLYHGDCREVLPRLVPESVDLLVTDPPYGVRWQSANRAEAFPLIAGDDGTLDVPQALRLALRALRQNRHVYIFGRFDLADLPLSGVCELIWDKELLTGGDTASGWAQGHEYVQFGMYANAAQRRRGYGNGAARLRRASVLRYPRVSGAAVERHPSEKPVPLLRELVEMSSRFGETVLDPFAGSGSTLVAAKLEGRKAIGIEVEERYCAVAADRLRQQVLPLAM